jgi:hypothetical protein
MRLPMSGGPEVTVALAVEAEPVRTLEAALAATEMAGAKALVAARKYGVGVAAAARLRRHGLSDGSHGAGVVGSENGTEKSGSGE